MASDAPGVAMEPSAATAITPAARTTAWFSPDAAPAQSAGTAATAACVNADTATLIPSPNIVVPVMMCDQNGIGCGAPPIQAMPPPAVSAPMITSGFVPIDEVSRPNRSAKSSMIDMGRSTMAAHDAEYCNTCWTYTDSTKERPNMPK